MKKRAIIKPAPMLVIAAGSFAGTVLARAQLLFDHGDARHLAMVDFYKVIEAAGEDGGLKLEKMVENTGTAAGNMQAQASSSLEAVLHDLRLHVKFLEMGLAAEDDLSLGIIVLVDLTEPGSEILYLLIEALAERMAKEPDSYLYLLCKTATFEEDPLRNLLQARVHLHLQELSQFLQDLGSRLQIYLFDDLKEGLLEVKDEHEAAILMQNFLLALLSGRLSQRIAQTYGLADETEQEVFFNSAGATALIYDPAAVQQASAMHLAVETLAMEFLSDVIPDPAQTGPAVRKIFESIGTVSDWAINLCTHTPFQTSSAVVLKLELHFSDLQFEGLPPLEWGDAIAGYGEHFQEELETIHFEVLKNNAAVLRQTKDASLQVATMALPAHSSLYPGGIAHAQQVLRRCIHELSRSLQVCPPVQNEGESLNRLNADYSSAMDRLDQAIEDLPEPPTWMKRLPGKLHAYAKMLFEFLFLRRQHAQLLIIRQQIIQALEAKFLFQFEQRLRNSMVELCRQLVNSLGQAQGQLSELQTKLQNLKNRLQSQAFNSTPKSSLFCIQVDPHELFQWAYEHKHKSVSAIRRELLEGGSLDDWHNLSEENLYKTLISACWPAYQFLTDLNVEQVLKETGFADLAALLALLTQGAVPALRPDFDAAGEASSYVANYFLCADPRESELPGILSGSIWEWRGIPTGDPYVIMCCRVRQMIPWKALSPLLHSAEAAFDKLNEQEQRELREVFEVRCR